MEGGRGGDEELTDAGQRAEGDGHAPGIGVEQHQGRDEGEREAGRDDDLELDLGHVGQGEAAEDLAEQDAAADDRRLQADLDAVGRVEGGDDLRPQHGERVVDHGADGRDDDDGVEADVLEQAGRHEGLRVAEVALCLFLSWSAY